MVCRTKSLNPSASLASAALPKEAYFSSKASAEQNNVGKRQQLSN
jgi:hypothetical protein